MTNIRMLIFFFIVFQLCAEINMQLNPLRSESKPIDLTSNSNKIYFAENVLVNKPSHGRLPLIDKVRCHLNEFLYPGDTISDWVCDCKPGFIYFPVNGACYEAHRRGPCKEGEILKIIKPSFNPKCVINECKRDGYVLFNEKCQQLDNVYACRYYQYLIGRKTYLTTSPSTYELTCADIEHVFECDGICCKNYNGGVDCFQRRYS